MVGYCLDCRLLEELDERIFQAVKCPTKYSKYVTARKEMRGNWDIQNRVYIMTGSHANSLF